MDRLRVAVIEDWPLVREDVICELQDAGCEVVAEFGFGEDFLDWWAGKPEVDALFFDCGGPGIYGYELYAQLQNPPPTVFFSADPKNEPIAPKVGAFGFLYKPIRHEKLQKLVDGIKELLKPKPSEK